MKHQRPCGEGFVRTDRSGFQISAGSPLKCFLDWEACASPWVYLIVDKMKSSDDIWIINECHLLLLLLCYREVIINNYMYVFKVMNTDLTVFDM